MGYDAVRRLERLPATNPDPIGLPDAWFGIFDAVIAFDHVRHRLLFVTHADERRRRRPGARPAESARGASAHPERPRRARRRLPPLTFKESSPRSSYLAAVERAKEHIRAGDVFQVVLSRRWSAPFVGRPVRGLPRAALHQPVAVPVLPEDAARRDLRGLARAPRPRRGGARAARPRDDPARRHAAARRDARGGPRLRERAPRRPEGARRARDARGPRAERPRPRREGGERSREDFFRVERYLPRHAHRLARDGRPRGRQGRRRRARRDVSRPGP